MNETTAQFLITVSDVLDGARIGRLPVIARVRGDEIAGVPGSSGEGREVDDTGRGRRVEVGGVTIDLEEIEQITLLRPQAPPDPGPPPAEPARVAIVRDSPDGRAPRRP